jgi:DNA adenine methylase
MKLKGKLFNWIGGKKWLSKDLNSLFTKYENKNIKYYIEPFAGGLGSFLFTLETLKKNNIKKIYLNDINISIISTYKHIKNNKNKIYKEYELLEKNYKKTIPEEAYKLHKTNDKKELRELLVDSQKFFLDVRIEFNKTKNEGSIKSTALFLFLMQHCFNSVYRENLSGGFNSPYNWETGVPNFEAKKEIFNEHSEIFNEFDIEFYNESCFSFLEKLKDIIPESLLYCDPPYLNEKKAENKYNKDHFGLTQQIMLLDILSTYDYAIFSNHQLEIFETFCNNNNFNYLTFHRNNNMSAKNESRKEKIPEILGFKI